MPTPPMLASDIAKAVAAFKKHGTKSGAAKELGCDESKIRRALARAKEQRNPDLPPEITEEERLRARVRVLEVEAKRLRERHFEAINDHDVLVHIKEKIYGLSREVPVPPTWLSTSGKSSGVEAIPVVIASDFHYGEVVDKREMGGSNKYDPDIADRRIQKLAESIIQIADNRPKYTIPGLVLCLGGDMISGDDLHAELTESNAGKTVEMLLRVQGSLITMIETLAARFGKLTVPCVVGNHGRNTQKPRFKKRVFTNYEYLLYRNLEMFFRGDKRIQFMIPDETDCHFIVQGHRYLLTHGDTLGVKGGDGIIGVLGPIMRGKFKVSRAEADIGRPFDTMIIGHWHQAIMLKGVIVNGALKGYDEYARLCLRAPFEKATQVMWFNHPKHGPVDYAPILVQE